MMSFYGLSLKEYRKLTVEDRAGLWMAITVIEARDQLQRLQVADWPNMKNPARKKAHRELHAQGYPPHLLEERDGKVMSTEEFASFIASGGKKRG
jgi:hypothetical protein